MHNKNVIVFDFDGTLADSTALEHETILHAIHLFGHEEITDDNLEENFGPTESGIIRKIVGEKNFPEAWTCFLEDYIHLQKTMLKKFPGMDDLLDHLSKKKDLLLLLVTGRSRETAEISLSYLGYEHYFGKIYTGSEEGINKDESIQSLLKDFGVAKENVLYIGDTIADIKTMHSIDMDLLSAGYSNFDPENRKRLEELNPGNVVYSVKELKKKLEEFTK